MSRRVFTLLGAIVAALVVAGAAIAYWAATGTGIGSAQSATMTAPVIVDASATDGDVTIDWNAPTEPAGASFTYEVTRDDDEVPCSSATATECVDEGVATGTYEYRVIARLNSWSSTSEPTEVDVTGGATDTTAPSSTAALSPEPNAAGWNKADVTMTLQATDADSGVKRITYSASGAQTIAETVANVDSTSFSVTAEGTTTITYFAEDNTGNVESPRTQVVKLDRTNPVVTITPDRPANATGWYRSSVGFTASATDPGGSGDMTCDAPKTYAGPDTASASVTMACVDAAGNEGTKTHSFKYDAAAPTLNVTAARSADHDSWFNAPIEFSVSGQSDATSGIATCDAAVNHTTDGQNLTVSRTCTDNAGNIGTGTSSTFKYDDTDPTVSIATNRTANANGWINADPTFTATAADATSGAGTCDAPITRTTDTATGSVAMSCADLAGNSGSDTKAYKLDKTNPVVAFTQPAANATVPRGNVSASGTSADANDDTIQFAYRAANAATWTEFGLVGTSSPHSATWNTAALSGGSYELRITGTDKASNATSVIRTVTVPGCDSILLTSNKATWVDQSNQSTNNGASTFMDVFALRGNGTSSERSGYSLIGFPAASLPAGCVVTKAELRLALTSIPSWVSSGDTRTLTVKRVATSFSWSESTTWSTLGNNWPTSVEATPSATRTFTNSSTIGQHTLDVTNVWGAGAANGFRLADEGTIVNDRNYRLRFAGNDHGTASNRPALTLTLGVG